MREITGAHVWTAPEVEAETVDGYFMPWQGGNAKLNAYWAAQRREREREKAWWAEYLRGNPPASLCNIPLLSGRKE